jgi:prevent-host-death family protein
MTMGMSKREPTMPAGEFKARCLEVMDRVARTRRPVTITKRGRPVARLVPIEPESEDFLGSLRDRIRIAGDIATSVEPSERWETEQEWGGLCRDNPPR